MFFRTAGGGLGRSGGCGGGPGGGVGGVRGRSWGAKRCPGYRCARSIENFCRIKMVVARASGMDLASILKRNTFLTLEVRPAGGPGSARDGGTEGAPGRGDRGGPGTGRTFVKWLIFLWGADVPLTKPHRVPPHGLYYTLYFWRGVPPIGKVPQEVARFRMISKPTHRQIRVT